MLTLNLLNLAHLAGSFLHPAQPLVQLPVLSFTDFLPALGGIGFGTFLAVLLEFAKLAGVDERYSPWITIVAGALWTGLALAANLYPASEQWIVWVLTLFMTAGAVPVSSSLTYQHAIKPAMKKRWNRIQD